MSIEFRHEARSQAEIAISSDSKDHDEGSLPEQRTLAVTLNPYTVVAGKASLPKWVLAAGFDPLTDPQVAVFGEKADLEVWRKKIGLPEEFYPIEPSIMGAGFCAGGTHIDVYGAGIIEQVLDGRKPLSAKEFSKIITESRRLNPINPIPSHPTDSSQSA